MNTHTADADVDESRSQRRTNDSSRDATGAQPGRDREADPHVREDGPDGRAAIADERAPARASKQSMTTSDGRTAKAPSSADRGDRPTSQAASLQRTRGNHAVARAVAVARDRRDDPGKGPSDRGRNPDDTVPTDAGSAESTTQAVATRSRGRSADAGTPGREHQSPGTAGEERADAGESSVAVGTEQSMATGSGDGPSQPSIPSSEGAPDAGLPRSGRPLRGEVRETMEARFDHDFGDVRVHTGVRAVTAQYDARALTEGTDIYFGPGQYRPGAAPRRGLLAHELTHVVQQRNAGTTATAAAPLELSHPGDATEREAQDVAQQVAAGEDVRVEEAASAETVHRNALGNFVSNVGSTVSDAADSAYNAGANAVQSGVEAASETAQAATEVATGAIRKSAEYVEEQVETVAEVGRSMVERIAPGLVDFLVDPAERVGDVLCSGVDTFVAGAFELFEGEDVDILASVRETFQTASDKVSTTGEQLQGGLTATLDTVLGPFVTAIEDYGIPALEGVQGAIATVEGAFESVLDGVGQPVGEFLETVGGAVWRGILDIVDWVWGLAEPLRQSASTVWQWVTKQFGIAWERKDDAQNWLLDKASAAWESVKRGLKPVTKSLRRLGESLSKLAEFGPIVRLSELLGSLWESVVWLWQNWDTEAFLVKARTILRESVLPDLLSTIDQVGRQFGLAAEWLTGLVEKLHGSIAPLLGAIGANDCLESVARVVGVIRDQFDRLAEWARAGFTGLAAGAQTVLDGLAGAARTILDFLMKLGQVIANPIGIPALIGGTLWRALPDRFKPPIISFIFEVLVTFVKGIPAFASALGPLAMLLKQGVLGFLERLRDAGKDTKKAVSDRIARLLQGSLSFVSGFLQGMLRGIWEGLTDPFVILYMLVQVAVRASRYLYDWIRGAIPGGRAEQADGAAEAQGGSQEAARLQNPRAESDLGTATRQTAGAEAEFSTTREQAASQENATAGGLYEMLKSVWNQVTSKASDIGDAIAEALLNFFRKPDFELGDTLGWVAGTALFEVVLAILTGPAYRALRASKPVLRGILRVLDFGGEILGALGRQLAKIRGPVQSALDTIGGFVRNIPGMGGVFDRVSDALSTLFRYSDDAAAADRGTREAVETGAQAGERAARATGPEAGERAARETTEEAAGQVRTVRMRNAHGELHKLKVLPDGRLMRCSPQCTKFVDNIANRAERITATAPENSDGHKIADNLQMRARELQKAAASGESSADEVLEELQDIERQMSKLHDQIENYHTGVLRQPPDEELLELRGEPAPTTGAPGAAESFDDWLDTVPTKSNSQSGPAFEYQDEVTGDSREYALGSGPEYTHGESPPSAVVADGINESKRAIQDAKHIGEPLGLKSPYEPGSSRPEFILRKVRYGKDPPSIDTYVEDLMTSERGPKSGLFSQLERYAMVIADERNPLERVELITNSPAAKVLFERHLRGFGIPGEVRLEASGDVNEKVLKYVEELLESGRPFRSEDAKKLADLQDG